MRNKLKWLLIFGILLVTIGTTRAAISQRHQVKELDNKIFKIDNGLKHLNDTTIEHLQNQTEEQKKQIEQLKIDLQAKREARASLLAKLVPHAQAAPPPPPAPLPAPVSASGDKLWIYLHESGNNPAAVNSIGCRGLGQACPGSKLPCGNDYACQDAWFTQYMLGRYGSWSAAKAFWLSHNWW